MFSTVTSLMQRRLVILRTTGKMTGPETMVLFCFFSLALSFCDVFCDAWRSGEFPCYVILADLDYFSLLHFGCVTLFVTVACGLVCIPVWSVPKQSKTNGSLSSVIV